MIGPLQRELIFMKSGRIFSIFEENSTTIRPECPSKIRGILVVIDDILSNEVVVNFNVFGPFMTNITVSNLQRVLIITLKRNSIKNDAHPCHLVIFETTI